MKKLTPILLVETIEPSLPFWTDGLGFEVTDEVREEDRLEFVILHHGELELMLQTHASAEKGDARLAAELRDATTCLYIEVEDLAAIQDRLQGVEVLVAPHTTFYGAREVYVRAPGGPIVGLA